MSHDDDCSAILGRVMHFIDNELEAADCATIQAHLDACAPCLQKFEVERTVKTLVSRSCTEIAPNGLRQRIQLTIQQIDVYSSRDD